MVPPRRLHCLNVPIVQCAWHCPDFDFWSTFKAVATFLWQYCCGNDSLLGIRQNNFWQHCEGDGNVLENWGSDALLLHEELLWLQWHLFAALRLWKDFAIFAIIEWNDGNSLAKETVTATMASFYNFQTLKAFWRRLYCLNGPHRDARLVPRILNYSGQLQIEMCSPNKITSIHAKYVCHDIPGP